jgi:hypothetical protein
MVAAIAGLASSNVPRFTFGIVLLAICLPLLSKCTSGPARSQRFARYLAHFHRRHAAWIGEVEPPARGMRTLGAIVTNHSLLRLLFRPEWDPLPPPSRARAALVLLALVQACAAAAMAFLLPPIRAIFAGGDDVDHLASSEWPTLRACGFSMAVHLLVRFGLDRLLDWRQRLLFRRPDALGRTEGHLLARAALAHFDEAHTLRSCLQICARSPTPMPAGATRRPHAGATRRLARRGARAVEGQPLE